MAAADSERLKLMVDLMEHQDTITWTAFEVSLAVQAAMGTIYAQFSSTRAPGAAALGVLLAVGFGLMILRSNRYMTFYAKKAGELGLPEPKLSRMYSATWIMAAMHVALAGGWLIVLLGIVVL